MIKPLNKIRAYCLACLVILLSGLTISTSKTLAEDLPTIAVFSSHDSAPFKELATSFRAELRSHYPGAIFSYSIINDNEKEADRGSIQNVRRQNPKLILALGTTSVRAAVQEFPDTPIIASMVIDNDAFAGAANATGLLLQIPPGTHLWWLNRFLPDLKRVAVIYNPDENQAWIDKAKNIAGQHGMKIVPIRVKTPKHLPRALKELNRKGEVLLGVPDRTVYSRKTAKMVLLSSFRSKIPFVGLSQSWVKAGGIYGLDWDYGALGKECAKTAAKILGGVLPVGDIPVRAPVEYLTYSINLKTARNMNLDIDPALLAKAAMVFE